MTGDLKEGKLIMTTDKATPRPWRIGDAGHTVFGPKTDSPSPVTVAGNLRERDNVRLIVKAVNAYDAHKRLVEVAKRVRREVWQENCSSVLADDLSEALRAVEEVDK